MQHSCFDELVRDDPEGAYTPEFMVRLR